MTILRTLPALAIGAMLSSAAAPVAAQRGNAAKCTSGWAGTIQYSRNQANSDSKTVTRLSGKGTQTTDWSLKANYTAQIAVRPAADAEYSTGLANINASSVSTETVAANDRDICPHQRVSQGMSGNFVSKSETRAGGSGLEAGIDVTTDTDTYTVSVRLPEVNGTVSGSDSASFSGQCKAKEATSKSIADLPTTIDAIRFSTDGEERLNPGDPNRLTGSFSKSAYGVTETLSWNLRRCGPALRLVEVKFEDMRFPTWEAWQEITEQTGTIDGNIVRIKAIVANDGPDERAATVKFRETYQGDKWDAAKPDAPIEEVSVVVPSGEQREVTFQWDSSGYAWFDDGRPRLVQRIRAELEDAGKKVDDMTRNLKVAPKPVVLVHGLWSNWRTWEPWQNILTTSHSYDWKAFPVGEKPEHGRMSTGEEPGTLGPTNTIVQNADQLGRYVEYAQKDRNAWHVDIVAHSMGGLISRRYIHAEMPSYADGKPQVAHLVMLGTPNQGSSCADLMSAALELTGRSMTALQELQTSSVAKFNAVTTERKGVPFSVLAGTIVPPVCRIFSMNDGVVAPMSAIWTIADNVQQRVLHTDMTGTAPFSSFVKPRLAIGPKAARSNGKLSALTPWPGIPDPAPRRLMVLGVEDPKETTGPDFSKIVRLAPGQTTQVPLPVEDARNFGLTFMAANTVSATLIDDKGTVVAINRAGTAEASQMFRSLFVDRAIVKGNWTLTLASEDRVEREIVLATWSNAS